MHLYRSLFLLFALLGTASLMAQSKAKRPEFRVEVSPEANSILKAEGYSLDHGSTAKVSYVVGGRKLLRLLDSFGYKYEKSRIVTSQVATVALEDVASQLAADNCFVPVDAYPSYELYEELMQNFADNFPELVRLHELGTLSSGRKILALEITDNPDEEEEEPKLLLSSSMHGDELGGYHVTLRLIAHLLCNYGSDAELTTLIDGAEIWINPLANPDGAYRNDNANITNPSRGNMNYVDLNRNFPDPDDGVHPDGLEHQEETLIFMQFAEDYKFDLGMNIHGGAEVLNYPWDTYAERTADDDWWIHVTRQYADSCQHAAGFNGYMSDLSNGITNGYDWYPIHGGRQDYTTYFHRSREVTLEISSIKTTPPSQFNSLWDYNRRPLINFLKQGTYGLRGTVTDSITGAPLEAQVYIPGHDALNSDVFTKLPTGRYHRYLKAGVYTVLYTAEGYHPKTISYSVNDNEPAYLHVQLAPLEPSSAATLENSENMSVFYQNGMLYVNEMPIRQSDWKLQLLSVEGRELAQTRIPANQQAFQFSVGQLPIGVYICRVFANGRQRVLRFSTNTKKKR